MTAGEQGSLTFADRDLVTLCPAIMDRVHTFTARPGDDLSGASALGLPRLRVIETAGDADETERQQWHSGNNAVALRRGVVCPHNCMTCPLLRDAVEF